MTLGAIVESIRAALERQADDVQVHRESGETFIEMFVGKQLFVVKCSESAPIRSHLNSGPSQSSRSRKDEHSSTQGPSVRRGD